MRRVAKVADLARYAKKPPAAPVVADEPEKLDSPKEEKAEAAAPIADLANAILKAVASVAVPAPPVMKLPAEDPRIKVLQDALVKHQADTKVALGRLQQAAKASPEPAPAKANEWDIDISSNRFGMMDSVVITPKGGKAFKVNVQRNEAGRIRRLSVKQ
jgi:hypothetical protein